ncbi:MAG: hypothetical protein R2883_01605 [Caldisericia bacterium]
MRKRSSDQTGDKPVVVLSNNDGFIVAADRKAKSLGIKTIS